MEKVIRVEYYVGLDCSKWTITEADSVRLGGSDIYYNMGVAYNKTTELLLGSYKIMPCETLQDKNINRKDFNLCFYIDCLYKDVDTAKAKLKGRVILLLTKHQNKIDKLMSNL